MKYKIVFGLALLVLVIVINSCQKNVGYVAVVAAPCDTAGMTYSSGAGAPIQTIINTQCAVSGCHAPGSPKANGDFSTYANVYLHASGGKSSAMYTNLVGPTTQPMPNIAQPGWDPNCMKAKLVEWILIGAPQ